MTVNLNAFPTAIGPMSTKSHTVATLWKRHFIFSQQAGPSGLPLHASHLHGGSFGQISCPFTGLQRLESHSS
jgi:hypothetical protein